MSVIDKRGFLVIQNLYSIGSHKSVSKGVHHFKQFHFLNYINQPAKAMLVMNLSILVYEFGYYDINRKTEWESLKSAVNPSM
jgi:hypothetical protein